MEPQPINATSIEATAGLLLLFPVATNTPIQTKLLTLLTEAQQCDPDLDKVQAIDIPTTIADRMEQWVQFLLIDVIHQWRMLPSSDIDSEPLLRELISQEPEQSSPFLQSLRSAGLEKSLQQTLEDYIQDLYTQQQKKKLFGFELVNWLELKASQLEHGFTRNQDRTGEKSIPFTEDFLVQLSSYGLALSTKYLQSLTTILVQIRRLGSQAALRQLNTLSQTLQTMRDNYAQQYQDHLRREKSAQKAYKNLLFKIGEQRRGSREAAPLWESALRALRLSYTSRLESEVFRLAEQILDNLMQPVQYLTLSIAQTDMFLIGVQQFSENLTAAATLPALLKGVLLDRIARDTLLRQLEETVGHPLDQWPNIEGLTAATVQQKLLQLLRPICFNVYVDCYLATIATPETALLPSIPIFSP